MKHIVIAIALLISGLTFAQPERGKMREKIKAEKIAFFTEQLELTTDEAKAFWPVYNKHESERNAAKKKYLRPIKQKFRSGAEVSDAEADKMLEDLITAEQEMHVAKLNLIDGLKGKLPAQKIIKLKAVEDAFNRKLLERLKKYRQNRKKD